MTIPAFARSEGMKSSVKAAGVSLLAAAGLAGAGVATGVIGGSGGLGGPDTAAAQMLEPFSDCDELLEYAHEHRWARNAYPYAGGGDVAVMSLEGGLAAGAEDSATRALAPEPGAVGPGETGTNVQEAGIDEPDIAKLAGTTLYRVDGKTLSSYDVSGDEAVLLDEIEIELEGAGGPGVYPHTAAEAQLLIAGDRALVLGTGYDRDGTAKTTVTEIDTADPAAMSEIRRLELEGTQVSARLHGSTARLVLESQPDYPAPEAGDAKPPAGATGETGAEAGEPEPEWLPQATLTDLKTGESEATVITGCADVSFPERFSGLGLLSVLTIDLDDGLAPADVEAVMTDGATVYASAESLYVSTASLTPPREGIVSDIGRLIEPSPTTVPSAPSGETLIHRFDASEGGTTEYAASGEVPGRLIGQFAMSEHDGVLRVASTEGETWAGGAGESESMITTLAERDGTLEELGQVRGLGPGEEIYAVRFIGDMGYVVTFEQTDPLYTVDLSIPEDPEVTGELKIPGYSAYLHPVGDGLLLGIGQAGTDSGMITGAQASLFDVADPERPERLDALDLTNGHYGQTSTEWDHHAFMYSPEHGMAVVPVQSYGRRAFNGAVALEVGADGRIRELSEIEGAGQIERTLLAGDNLVTVASNGVSVRPIETLGAIE